VKNSEFVYLHRSTLKQEALVAVGMLLVLVLFRFQAFLNINSAFLGGYERDAGLYIWLAQSNMRDLFELPWFNTRAFYPYTLTLAWSDNFILPSYAIKAFTFLGFGFTASYNLVLLGASFLNGYATYRLCFRLTGALYPSFISGAGFLSFAFLSAHLGHPQLQFAFFIPMTFLAFFSFLVKDSFWLAMLMGCLVFLTFLSHVHYSILLILGLASLSVSILLLRPFCLRKSTLAKLFSGASIGIAPVLFFAWPYMQTKSAFGARHLYEAHSFAATALSYLSTHSYSLLYGFTHSWSHAEAQLFPGLAVLTLSFFAFLRLVQTKRLKIEAITFALCFAFALLFSLPFYSSSIFIYLCSFFLWLSLFSFAYFLYRLGSLERKLGFEILTNRALIASFLFTALVFFALSLGPLGNPEEGQYALGVHSFFYYLLPGFDSIRAIGRLGIVAIFCCFVASAFFLSLLVEKKKFGSIALTAVLSLILLENFTKKYPLENMVTAPPVFNFFEDGPDDDSNIVMILPFTSQLKANETVKSWGDYARLNVNYMNWMINSDWHIVNGYSGQRSKVMLEYPRKMSGFPDARSINSLAYISGLRYVVYLPAFVPEFDDDSFADAVADFASDIRLIRQDSTGSFLFEYIGGTLVRDTFHVLTPSYPEGLLSVELMTEERTYFDETRVGLYLQNEERPFANITLLTDGKWHFHTIETPQRSYKVPPHQIVLKSEEGIPVYIRRRPFRLLE